MPQSEVPNGLDDPDLIAARRPALRRGLRMLPFGARVDADRDGPCDEPDAAADRGGGRRLAGQPSALDRLERRQDERDAGLAERTTARTRSGPSSPIFSAVQRGLSPDAQRVLVAQPVTQGPPGAAYCTGCHGEVGSFVPRLDIQTAGLPDRRAAALPLRPAAERDHGRGGKLLRAPRRCEALAELVRHRRTARRGRRHRSGGAAWAKGWRAPAPTTCPPAPPATARTRPSATRAFPACRARTRAFLATQLRLWRDGIRGGLGTDGEGRGRPDGRRHRSACRPGTPPCRPNACRNGPAPSPSQKKGPLRGPSEVR